MASNGRKNADNPPRKQQSILDILKKQPEFEDITQLKKEKDIEIAAFKLRGINLILEKRSGGDINFLRLINSFNPKGLDITKEKDGLVKIANEFNRKSIGIKSAIAEESGVVFIIFSVEEIAIEERMLNLSSASLKVIAGMLSGAPALFEKVGK